MFCSHHFSSSALSAKTPVKISTFNSFCFLSTPLAFSTSYAILVVFSTVTNERFFSLSLHIAFSCLFLFLFFACRKYNFCSCGKFSFRFHQKRINEELMINLYWKDDTQFLRQLTSPLIFWLIPDDKFPNHVDGGCSQFS